MLFACPAMAENIFQDIERTNLDMLMIAAGWLRGARTRWASHRSRTSRSDFHVDPELRNRLILVPSVVAMMLIIAMGVIVFTARRE